MKIGIHIFTFLIVVLLFTGCKKDGSSGGTTDTGSSSGAEVTLSGNVMDIACGSVGKGMDGSEITTSPQDHSKKCLVACEPSGYGIMYKEGSSEFYSFVPFDDAGTEKAIALIEKSTKEKDIRIEVTGTLVDGRLQVSTLVEK